MSLDIALACAERGWPVFPVEIVDKGDGRTDKKPRVRWGTEYSTDPDQIRRWWRTWPSAAVGVPTGARSGLYVVDVDRPAAVEEAGLSLSTAKWVDTNRPGGRHAYFGGPLDGRPVKNSAEGGLDFRGDGGFVVCWHGPPSGTLSPLPQEAVDWARSRSGGNTSGPADVIPETIEEGGRETAMVSMAGTMRRRGMSEAAILAALGAENEARCIPPLPQEDLERIAGSVMRYEPSSVPRGAALRKALLGSSGSKGSGGEPAQYELAVEAAMLLSNEARWRDDERQWWMSSGGFWAPQREMGVNKAVTEVVIGRKPDASAPWTSGVERYLRECLVVNPSNFDQHPWLLGVQGGVVDLKTGERTEPDSSLLLTRCAPTQYIKDSPCPTWKEHMRRLFEGDDERILWFQKAVGASLVGDSIAKDQVFVVVLGEPGNGKGTAMRALLATLGQDQHAISLNPKDFTNRDRHLAWMMRLRGARIAIVEELDRKPLNVAMLKALTGGDPLIANKMRQDDETWMPTHTLFMTSNHAPNFGGDVIGLSRRYRPIPTGPSLDRSEISVDHEEMIKAETTGILSWAVEGCLLWQADGRKLLQMAAIDELAEEHLKDNDPFLEWADECITIGEGWSSRKQVISCLDWWLAGRGMDSLKTQSAHRELYAWLRGKGAQDMEKNKGRGFNVVCLTGPVVD